MFTVRENPPWAKTLGFTLNSFRVGGSIELEQLEGREGWSFTIALYEKHVMAGEIAAEELRTLIPLVKQAWNELGMQPHLALDT